ncbi:MAG: trypsin-like peptidase domain-containing protein [Gammaproteobacteria bacterium AqS3]|nr:trypsin-like peptidase domain-containing protein [Gammaproteobacteria bacterium AqS3]
MHGPHGGTNIIMQQGGGFTDAVERAASSVVNIRSIHRTERAVWDPFAHFFGRQQRRIEHLQTSLGSAVIIDPIGYLLTNEHVIRNATDIEVELAGGRTAKARRIGSDPETDLAVLHISPGEFPVSPIAIGSAESLHLGETVLAIGNPLGLGQTVTQGIVSATHRNTGNPYAWFIQTDAAINRGNSGGALIDTRGRLVGINTFIVSASGGSDGLGFAIPVEIAMDIASEIITEGRVRRGSLGLFRLHPVAWVNADDQAGQPSRGLLVQALDPAGPMSVAGIRLGDVIIRYNGMPIDADGLNRTVLRAKAGDTIQFDLLRGGQVLSIRVPLVSRSR